MKTSAKKESLEKDSQSRDKIASVLDINFFVEAGAGSGKTYCLVGRMVSLIKKGKAKIENIAAVTFTRKAAAELKERFQIRLEQSLNDNGMTVDEKRNIGEAILNLEQIYIGTIHSFCAKILRERPVESGIDPDFEEIEEDKDFIYAEQAWSDFIDHASENDGPSLRFMEENGIEPKDLKDTYHRFIQFPEVEMETSIVVEPDFSEAKKEIKKFLNICRDMLPKKAPEKGWDSLQNIIRKSNSFVSFGYLEQKRLFIRLLNELCKTPDIVQNRWPDGNSKECREKMTDLQDRLLKPALKSWQEYTHKPLIEFIKKGTDFYRKRRKFNSVLNFGDLLTMTSDLLRDNSEVRNYFKRKFTHILVDEFQDTDPVQAEIILFLTGSDIEEKNWRYITPERGSLFLVGDPKQSIYRFRRADIDIYNAVKEIFSGECCEVLELYVNRRSLPFMQELVESVFMKILPGKEEEETEGNKYQAKYSPLITDKELNKSCDFGLFENNITKTENSKASEMTWTDALRISEWIYSSVNKGRLRLQRPEAEKKAGLSEKPDYSDFLILTKTRRNLGLYARALEKKGIPYDISGGLVFNESLELKEILKLFKAIDDDRDPVSLVSALRGLFFGISDESLYNFKKAGGNFSYYSPVPAGFSAFEEAFQRLREYKEIIGKNDPASAAEEVIETSGIIPLALSEEEGLTRAGNIYKALELLKDYDDRMETFYDLIKNMEEILKNKETESMSLLVSKKNVVRLMNLHKAKGLEASVVILADPMGESRYFEPQYHISRTINEKAKGYFSISRPTSAYSSEILSVPPGWDDKLSEEKKYEEAEKRRLEYVAMTRAKNILVVSTYREGAKAKAWEIMYDLLETAKKIEVTKNMDAMKAETFDISISEWKKEKDSIRENLSNLSRASYRISNITSEAKENFIFSSVAVGKGAKWGSIAHKAIELACRGGHEKLNVLVGKWMDEAGMQENSAIELIALIDTFMKSSLWKRISSASLKLFETAFGYESNGTISYGVIDLIFKEDEKWIIVDYKTDDYEKDIQRKEAYTRQLDLYKKYWEDITKEEVSETILYKL
ncbi:MAG: UvrD-helicase domain-containing protein [Candidatus Humimicrobiaceae bacterium]